MCKLHVIVRTPLVGFHLRLVTCTWFYTHSVAGAAITSVAFNAFHHLKFKKPVTYTDLHQLLRIKTFSVCDDSSPSTTLHPLRSRAKHSSHKQAILTQTQQTCPAATSTGTMISLRTTPHATAAALPPTASRPPPSPTYPPHQASIPHPGIGALHPRTANSAATATCMTFLACRTLWRGNESV